MGDKATAIKGRPHLQSEHDGPRCAEEICQRHGGRVVAYFLRSGFTAADADDLTQEVFVRVVRSAHTFDPQRGSLGGWLGAIARNVARRYWARRKLDVFDPELADAMFSAPIDEGDSPAAREETAAVRDCVAALSGELGKLVRLRYVDGLTTRAIAGRMKMPEATIRLRLTEARGAIERCLKLKGILE